MITRPAFLLAFVALVGCRPESQQRPAARTPATSATPAGIVIHPRHIQAGARLSPDSSPPAPPDTQAIRMGLALFNSYNCDGCHSDGAAGAVGPSLADGRWRYGGSPAEISQSILEGRPLGMPSYRAIAGQGTRYLVAYLLSLQDTTSIATQNLTTWRAAGAK